VKQVTESCPAIASVLRVWQEPWVLDFVEQFAQPREQRELEERRPREKKKKENAQKVSPELV
jgi:hypothetical protein